MRNNNGDIIGLVGVSVDITERQRDQERLQLMVNELNHRVKNTLATVQGIAILTLREVELPLRESFTARLQALAAVHDVLTRENWLEAFLHEVIAGVLAPYGGASNTRFQIAGPPVRIQPRVAVAFSMALHELITNAMKYGALSVATGQVAVKWRITDDAEPHLHFSWVEQGGPPVAVSKHRGFGIRLLERSLARDLGGTARLSFDITGLTCTIDTPSSQVMATDNVMPFVASRRMAGQSR